MVGYLDYVKLEHSTLNVGGTIPGACVLGCMKRGELSSNLHLFVLDSRYNEITSCKMLPP